MKRALLTLTLLAGVACADKTLSGPGAVSPTRLSFRVDATGLAPTTGTPAAGPYLVVASGYVDTSTGAVRLLGYSVRPAVPAEYAIDLEVDLAPCTDASVRIGKAGCALLLGAAILRDTTALANQSADPLVGAIDKQFPLGPFTVIPGRPVNVPRITLVLSGR